MVLQLENSAFIRAKWRMDLTPRIPDSVHIHPTVCILAFQQVPSSSAAALAGPGTTLQEPLICSIHTSIRLVPRWRGYSTAISLSMVRKLWATEPWGVMARGTQQPLCTYHHWEALQKHFIKSQDYNIQSNFTELTSYISSHFQSWAWITVGVKLLVSDRLPCL